MNKIKVAKANKGGARPSFYIMGRAIAKLSKSSAPRFWFPFHSTSYFPAVVLTRLTYMTAMEGGNAIGLQGATLAHVGEAQRLFIMASN